MRSGWGPNAPKSPRATTASTPLAFAPERSARVQGEVVGVDAAQEGDLAEGAQVLRAGAAGAAAAGGASGPAREPLLVAGVAGAVA